MKSIVTYKSKYGSTKKYAEWIAEELNCEAFDLKNIKLDDLIEYDIIIHGGGLYAEIIAGANFYVKNFEKLKDKKIIIYSTGITPLDCRDYYDKMVGAVMTNQYFTTPAVEAAKKLKILLWDRGYLDRMLEE